MRTGSGTRWQRNFSGVVRASKRSPTFRQLPEIVRKHYAKWSPARQSRIDDLMEKVHIGTQWVITEKCERLQ